MDRAMFREQRFVVGDANGLHLRPAALLARTAACFTSDIVVRRNMLEADAKSALSMMLLQAVKGSELTIVAQGADAEQAMAAISSLFTTGLSSSESNPN